MKIVQSFWTQGNKDYTQEGFGWLNPLDNLLSWTLSVNQLRQFYDDVTLVTDHNGYDLLIKKLHLPYTDVIVCLDELNNYNPNLWALAKIKAYSLMQEPFIHVDGDVFIFEPIHNELKTNDLIVQNAETTTDYYRNAWDKIRPCLTIIPESMKGYDQNIFNKAYNMGIFGGNDLYFIQDYCKSAFDFVNQNMPTIKGMDDANFNIFFEQVLLCAMVENKKRTVATYIKEDIGDNQYRHFADFDAVPENRKYLHALGFYKSNPVTGVKMQAFVINHYPAYYEYIEKTLNLKPTLQELEMEYTIENINNAKHLYRDGIRKRDLCKYSKSKQILLRNLLSIENTKHLQHLLTTKQNFKIYTTTYYEIKNDVIEIQEENGGSILTPKLKIDDLIFNLINPKNTREVFDKKAVHYLNEDFPKEKSGEFIILLWKRIKLLTSCGIFYIEWDESI